MSHFIVGVIHKPEQDIEELLAPYDEGLEVESYVYRTKSEIIKAAKEIVNNYNEDPDWYNNDKYRKNWIKKYLDAKTEEELYEAEISPDTYEYDEDGNELTTYNPDAKWDWWVVGGRWSDTLLVPRDKVDKTYLEYMDDDEEYWCTNEAKISDIFFGIDPRKYEDYYNWWKDNVEAPDEKWDSFYKKEYYTDNYTDADDYAKRCCAFSTFAVVTPDGKWHERGEMGWFGCSGESPEEGRDWDENYMDRFINNADPDDVLTIVDCHI